MTTAQVNLILQSLAAWEPEGTTVALTGVDRSNLRKAAAHAILRDELDEWEIHRRIHSMRGE
jgi:hypothetical protein